jgi:16S rRNA C1402 (ribose-2'-O) methylase RsmI
MKTRDLYFAEKKRRTPLMLSKIEDKKQMMILKGHSMNNQSTLGMAKQGLER